jgi:DNA-binding MarR family transcriptional regulator
MRLFSSLLEDTPHSHASDRSGEVGERTRLAQFATKVFYARTQRAGIFGAGMFGEPAWDMLLALYMLGSEGPRLSIGHLMQLSGTAQSTGLRWLQFLEDQKLVERKAQSNDDREAFVELTANTWTLLDSYFSKAFDSRN